jgi:antitoxin HicB
MKFAVTIEKDEDGIFVISAPVLHGCHSQGKTREEALDNIKEAIRGYITSLRKHGEPIPQGTEVKTVEVTA